MQFKPDFRVDLAMSKPAIVVFSGADATVLGSPPLVTSNSGRLQSETKIQGRYDHLVPQTLYEPVKVRIRKFSAHPLESDAAEKYLDDGKDYYEVTLAPEDGPYLLPYLARRADGSEHGRPFEAGDLLSAELDYGGRQFFYPDASWLFKEIDRGICGRSKLGEANILGLKAEYEFVRVLPSGGYAKKGEILGVDYFPSSPTPFVKRPCVGDLAKATNVVQGMMGSGRFRGGIWLDSSAHLEETLYWLSLLIDTDLPIVGVASQRAHGELSADGDRNIVDAVDYVISGLGSGLGAVATIDQSIFAARDFKKSDDRPGNYKATGGAGGILGSIKPSCVTIWYRPAYKHTSTSDVNLNRLQPELKFIDKCGDTKLTILKIKDDAGDLKPETIPRVHIVKFASYMQEDARDDPEDEVDIMAWINKARDEQKASPEKPKLHGLVYEGLSPYAIGAISQMKALQIAALSGLPVVRVSRGDPGGRVITNPNDLTIEGNNLDAIKARLLLMASMLKLGRLPKARDPGNPTDYERDQVILKIAEFQQIFETH